MWSRKLINKVAKKHLEGECFFCGNNDYPCLTVHRIIPGEDDGRYDDFNTIVVCWNCHEGKIHGKPPQIVIDRKYMATNQRGWVLHFWENGEEKWL